MTKKTLFLLLYLICSFPTFAKRQKLSTEDIIVFEKEILHKANNYLVQAKQQKYYFAPCVRAKVDTVYFNKRTLHVNFTEEFAYFTLRHDDVVDIYAQLRKEFDLQKRQELVVTVDDLPLEQYVPLYYYPNKDKTRLQKPSKVTPNVTNVSSPFSFKYGLTNKHIALWNSHGYYYSHEKGFWKWQRAPLFTTVEDLFTSAYVLPFLIPMLENAGANTYLPRERDVQTHEVIVDNRSDDFSLVGDYLYYDLNGFSDSVILDKTDINPFAKGDAVILGDKTKAIWQPSIPESGNYAVYVSYVTLANSCDHARYEVHHSGGITQFEVNQQMGGGTWIYLDDFYFEKGSDAFVLLNGDRRDIVTADAVRFGGGMGSVIREGKKSGAPRWHEAARYYLQYSGVNDTLVFNRHGDSIDYNDDFRSRARWVNYLMGDDHIEPWLTNDVEVEGFGIPIDMSFGLHTDAGHFPGIDTTIGTLGIYSTYDVKKNRDFYYGTSRMVNRDVTDIMQQQVVNDIRSLYDDKWTQREVWDKMYSEATFATVPSMMLELHAHSNAKDMAYGLDPMFRFHASRAMYKSMLRFLATYNGQKYIIQPLPVSDFAIEAKANTWQLSWSATEDKLEPSAMPHSYIVYSRRDGKGWDNGTLVNENNIEINVTDSAVYSYKVTAVNDGGESFPSVVLSACHISDDKPTLLVVDGFDRVSAPPFMQSGDSVGVAPWVDEGVAYEIDIATIGWQYEYDQNEPWLSDDIPGHGGSTFELVDKVFVGNNFDNSYSHVRSIANAGYNVVSSSMAALEKGRVSLSYYDAIDLLMGEQRTTKTVSGDKRYSIYSEQLMTLLEEYLSDDKARLIISGAHIANDAYANDDLKDARIQFVNRRLGFDYSCQLGDAHTTLSINDSTLVRYNVAYNKQQYRVEHVDVLKTGANGAKEFVTYYDHSTAAICFAPSYKVISAGFPFESVLTQEARDALMAAWLNELLNK